VRKPRRCVARDRYEGEKAPAERLMGDSEKKTGKGGEKKRRKGRQAPVAGLALPPDRSSTTRPEHASSSPDAPCGHEKGAWNVQRVVDPSAGKPKWPERKKKKNFPGR
jgi:hypothetical protein